MLTKLNTMTKLNAQITVHLSDDYQQAVQNLAGLANVSSSEWVRQLIEKELKAICLQAQDTLKAVACIENCESFES